MVFASFISFVILLRIAELILSKRNEKWLLQNGAVEHGKKHYPLIVFIHALFFLSIFIEYILRAPTSYSLILIISYFLLVALKAWIVLSLGKFWNTKIYRIPNFPLVTKGPYTYCKHPNYLIVIAEIAIIPLSFQLYYTAILFSILNALMLIVRIRAENKALET
ncbi:isoprenylcysteine carboxyl methyltransferase family protein [Sunxiuqinia sp. sy24]|uniref:isoprenylcysteine carboxyl methyltransferase family protein n=1 Tax=Sunxiuqinia sp. sy24 TaxID=3461495 RepID=UPI004045A32B